MCATHVLVACGSVFVGPWICYGTLNLTDWPCQFEVVRQPAMMSGQFAHAGVPIADVHAEPDRDPLGPGELRDILAPWGIECRTGPTYPVRSAAVGAPA